MQTLHRNYPTSAYAGGWSLHFFSRFGETTLFSLQPNVQRRCGFVAKKASTAYCPFAFDYKFSAMIQRIQSIYLLLAAGTSFSLFGFDIADTPAPQPESSLFADASFSVFDNPVLMAVFALAGVLFLVDIFLFRNRKLQVSLTQLATLIVGIGVGYGGYAWYTDASAAAAVPDIGIGMPLLSVIFAVLAVVGIKKDDKLVRSADRLR